MSLRTDLNGLLDTAERKIEAVKDLATSERNRLLDAVGHVRSTVESSEDRAVDAEAKVKAEDKSAK